MPKATLHGSSIRHPKWHMIHPNWAIQFWDLIPDAQAYATLRVRDQPVLLALQRRSSELAVSWQLKAGNRGQIFWGAGVAKSWSPSYVPQSPPCNLDIKFGTWKGPHHWSDYFHTWSYLIILAILDEILEWNLLICEWRWQHVNLAIFGLFPSCARQLKHFDPRT